MLTNLIQYCEGNKEIEYFVNTVIAKRIKENKFELSETEHILDYLKSDKAPKRLRKMSYAQAYRKTMEWNNSLIKKGLNIKETETDIEIIYDFKDSNGMKLVKLIGKSAYEKEGAMMRHCVASYFNRKDLDIYSLRDNNNLSHCTLEVSNENINQIKGKGNGPIHPKYINYILTILEKVFKYPVRESELANLGYVKYSNYNTKLLKTEFTGAKFLEYNKKEYYYQYSNLKRLNNA